MMPFSTVRGETTIAYHPNERAVRNKIQFNCTYSKNGWRIEIPKDHEMLMITKLLEH